MRPRSDSRIFGFLVLPAIALGMLIGHARAEMPNVLVIMLDDSGWTDFGCYGSEIETPNIDRLATQGMRFTDCHSAAPNCSPSRAGLLTGRTPSRSGIYSYRPPQHTMHLREEEITVAELLRERGYATGHFGKWHLSTLISDQPGPIDQGFDYSLGTDNNAAPSHLDPMNFVRNGEPVGEITGYSCQIVADETIGWLDAIGAKPGGDPFFACVWYHEPHTPIASPPELIAKYQERFPDLSKKDAAYYANIENVDLATGRILARLEELGIEENTLIFLTSDNGGLNDYSNAGLRGKKSNVWEGGHRVPGIFCWPGKIEAGSISEVPISGVDFLPTICELTDTELPPDRIIDGVSLASLLSGKSDNLTRDKPLYWFFYRLNPAIAIRDGRWSLIADSTDADRPKTHGLISADMPFIKSSAPVNFQLFDLESDLAQRRDVSAEHPEVVARLSEVVKQLHAEVIKEGFSWEIPPSENTRNPRIWDSY
ncbi:MAG: sulfatase [Verrucomicrobiota bacterium]